MAGRAGRESPAVGQPALSTAACDRLRHLAIAAGDTVARLPATTGSRPCRLDGKCRALVGLGAVVAASGGAASYQRCVAAAVAAGATPEEIIDVLTEVAPTIGLADLVSAAVALATALGYDLDEAFECLDEAPRASRPTTR